MTEIQKTATPKTATEPQRSDRGRHITRLEAFSDSVFGISAALLVISLDLPRNFAELLANLSGFVAFALSFVMLLMIWAAHNRYFRAFGLEDGWAVTLNGMLLFVVLFYVYPLKFLATACVEFFWHVGPYYDPDTGPAMLSTSAEMRQLMILYGIGFMAVFLCFTLLYAYAYHRRERLDLDLLEQHDARHMVGHYSIYVGVGLVSVLLVSLGIGSMAMAGWIYATLGPLCWAFGSWQGKKRQVLAVSLRSQA